MLKKEKKEKKQKQNAPEFTANCQHTHLYFNIYPEYKNGHPHYVILCIKALNKYFDLKGTRFGVNYK